MFAALDAQGALGHLGSPQSLPAYHYHASRPNVLVQPSSQWPAPYPPYSRTQPPPPPSHPHHYPSYPQDRPPPPLPPSLWMSPVSSPSGPYDPPPDSAVSPVSARSRSPRFGDIFEEMFPPPDAQPPPRVSGSPELTAPRTDDADNPVTKIWRLYNHHQSALPNAQRMENITWRMMTMKLRKDKDRELESSATDTPSPSTDASVKTEPGLERPPDARGRRIDKGKTKVQVVGFDGLNQDGVDDDECAPLLFSSSVACF